MHKLAYQTLETLFPPCPVDRLAYFVDCCRGLRVLDIGSYDETAYHLKKRSDQWLFPLTACNYIVKARI